MRSIALTWSILHCYANGAANGTFVPRTDWIRIADIKRIRAIFEMISAQSDARIQFAFKVAKARNEAPSATTFITKGNPQNSDGMNEGVIEDITNDVGANTWIRFGFKTWNNSEAALVCCAAGGTVEYMSC